jgi:hypothetical protein
LHKDVAHVHHLYGHLLDSLVHDVREYQNDGYKHGHEQVYHQLDERVVLFVALERDLALEDASDLRYWVHNESELEEEAHQHSVSTEGVDQEHNLQVVY